MSLIERILLEIVGVVPDTGRIHGTVIQERAHKVTRCRPQLMMMMVLIPLFVIGHCLLDLDFGVGVLAREKKAVARGHWQLCYLLDVLL